MREHGVRRVREGARQDDAAAVRSALQHQHPGLAAPGPGRHDQQGECDQGPRGVYCDDDDNDDDDDDAMMTL